jgi:hypothetical protein
MALAFSFPLVADHNLDTVVHAMDLQSFSARQAFQNEA